MAELHPSVIIGGAPEARLRFYRGDLLEDDLEAAMVCIFRRRGFTALQQAITRKVERIAKANREQLAREDWIA